MTYEGLSDLIERRRVARRWTKAELARRAGTSAALIGAIERGHSNVGVEVLSRIAEALGATLPRMLGDASRSSRE